MPLTYNFYERESRALGVVSRKKCTTDIESERLSTMSFGGTEQVLWNCQE